MNSALKDIIEALLAGIVAGLILLTLMISHTANQLDKPVDIDKIKSPDESLKITTKLP